MPESPEGNTPDQTDAQTPATSTPASTPPWGSAEDFNPEKAWNLITNLRDEVGSLKTARQEALDQVSARDASIEELKATVQLTDDSVKQYQDELHGIKVTRAKEDLLEQGGLPRNLSRYVIGEDEEAWKASIGELAALRGKSVPQPDPSQSDGATPTPPSRDEQARSFFDNIPR